MRNIWIATSDRVVGQAAGQKGSGRIVNRSTTWPTLSQRLIKFEVTDETFAEYQELDRNEQLRRKDVGSFVGGKFTGDRRRKDELQQRDLLSLDADHLKRGEEDCHELAYGGFAYAVHSTHKHSIETPRLRLVFPLKRPVTQLEYEAVARMVASWLDMEVYDDTTFQVARVMFWPSRSSDGVEYAEIYEGDWLDPDAILAEYEDWQDPFTWPLSARAKTPRLADVKVEYAPDKRGIVGAFCRVFDIHSAIVEFALPYEATAIDGRYTYTSGSSAEGAIVYDFDTQIFSHHESDPAYGGSRNAWDLTRIHLFGDLDASIREPNGNLPGSPTSWPSHKALVAHVSDNYPEVLEELRGERPEVVFDDLSGVSQEGTGEEEGTDTRSDFERIITRIQNCDTSRLLQATETIIAGYMDTLSATEVGQLVGHLRRQWIALVGKELAPNKTALDRSLKERRGTLAGESGDSPVDMQQELAKYILDNEFNGGELLKRTGKRFWTFESGLWAMDEDERIAGASQRVLVDLRKSDPEDHPALHAMIGDKETTRVKQDMMSYLRDNMADQSERDDPLKLTRKLPAAMNCMNGTLWFNRQGKTKFREHNPTDFFTIRLNTNYDPDAVCSLWDEFVSRAFSDTDSPRDMVLHLEELGGYILQMSRWIRLWVLCYGPTSTGKSTFQEVLSTLLGQAALARSMSDKAWDGQFGLQSLIGKLLITEDDMKRSHTLDDGLIKKFSEDKEVTTEIKYGSAIKFRSHAFFLINSNHWPRTRDISGAMKIRSHIIPFTYNFVEHGVADDSKRDQMVREELPGILNRFVAGFQRLRARNVFNEPALCHKAREDWLARANPAVAFCRERLQKATGYVRATTIWQAYRRWYANEYPGGGVLSRGDTLERIDHVLGARAMHHNQQVYKGWELMIIDAEDLSEGDMGDE